MQSDVISRPESRSPILWWICLAGFALVALTALRSLPQIADLLVDADGDDQMRLVEVRDWLAGQSWFDTHQYRVLPPDGISMHWSRYVDGGIAAVLLAASTMLAAPQAELATVILWPSLLACGMVLLHARGANRLLGPAGALGALAVFLSWSKLGGEFVPPRIDHHNVQMLCGTALFYLSVVPGRARLAGAIAGVVTAFSLAVGLEMLPYLATIWGLMALRHAFGEDRTGDWLLGFGAAITPAAPLLMAGQTPMADWGVGHCDVLAPPVLTLGAVGVVATLVPVLAERVISSPVSRIVTMVVITCVGLWLASPLLVPCLAGPYSNLPPAVRKIIETNVVEALPASKLVWSNPALLARVLLPPVVIATLALAAFWRLRKRLSPMQAKALLQAFVVVGVGLGFALAQIRAANLMTPAVPLLGGFLVWAFTLIPRASLWRIPAVLVLLLALPAVVEHGAKALPGRSVAGGGKGVSGPGTEPLQTCRTEPAMAEIASLPKSLIFSTLNLGPTILAYTPHSVTSATYHRSPEAIWNGLGAFETLDALHQALVRSGADYLVLCVGGAVERATPDIRALMSGSPPGWLVDVTAGRTLVRVFQVGKASLPPAGATP